MRISSTMKVESLGLRAAGVSSGGPVRAVVCGGEVRLDLRLRFDERQHPRPVAERWPGQCARGRVVVRGEVCLGRPHAGGDRLLAGPEGGSDGAFGWLKRY